MRTTYMANPHAVERKWYIIDAAGKRVGRLASEIASILRGKHKPEFTPNVDTGDFVIVINAEKVVFTGNKLRDKKYYRHSGYPGALRTASAGDILNGKRPENVLYLAVKGMLPHNTLGRAQVKKLKLYAGTEHPHSAQQPIPWESQN